MVAERGWKAIWNWNNQLEDSALGQRRTEQEAALREQLGQQGFGPRTSVRWLPGIQVGLINWAGRRY